MTFIGIACLIAFIINMFCGMQVYALHRKSKLNTSYLHFAICITGWTFASFLVQQTNLIIWAERITRLETLFWVPLGAFYLRFVHIFIGRPFRRIGWLLGGLVCVLLPLALFSPLVLPRGVIAPWGFTAVAGPLYIPTGVLMLLFPAIYGIILFYNRYRNSTDEQEKLFLKNVLRGTILMVTVASAVDLFPELLRLWIDLPLLPHVLPLTTTLFMLHAYFAVFHYNFLNIGVEEAAPHLFAHINEGVMLFDRYGQLTYTNPALSRILGHFSEKIKQMDERQIMERFGINDTASDERIEVRWQYSETPCFLALSQASYWQQGVYLGKLLLVLDITPRKLAQEKLDQLLQLRTNERDQAQEHARSRDALLEVLFENLPCELWAMDLNGRYTIQNPLSIAYWGNYIGKTVFELPIPEETKREWHRLVESVKQLDRIETDRIMTVPGRPLRHVHAIIVSIKEHDNVTGMMGLLLDVTAHRRSEEKARQLQTVVEQADATIMMTDCMGIITDINPHGEKLFGLSASELINSPVQSLWPKEIREKANEFWDAIANNKRWRGIVPFARKSQLDPLKNQMKVMAHLTPVSGKDGNIECMSILMRDVTRQEMIEEQLHHAQKMDVAGQLAGGIAHDFNNILSVMLGHAEICAEMISPESPINESIEAILTSGRRGAELTHQLLAISRRQPMESRRFELNHQIQEMEKMFSRVLPERIQLDVILDEDLPMIMGDPGQIDQVIMNLVVNARDAMPYGGHLLVKTYMQSEKDLTEGRGLFHVKKTHDGTKRVSSSLPEIATAVVMEITDSGIGMDDQTIAHIFEPFFTTKAKDKGTGLGLATSYGIVVRHGGRIDVESELGKGTSFKVLLPKAVSDIADIDEEMLISNENDQELLRILLVEDELDIRNFTTLALEKHGYYVEAISNPRDAFERLRANAEKFDLLLTDVVMPEMSGPELFSQIAAYLPSLKILFMTGYADILVDNPQLQQFPILIKPFTLSELLNAVKYAANSSQSVSS